MMTQEWPNFRRDNNQTDKIVNDQIDKIGNEQKYNICIDHADKIVNDQTDKIGID